MRGRSQSGTDEEESCPHPIDRSRIIIIIEAEGIIGQVTSFPRNGQYMSCRAHIGGALALPQTEYISAYLFEKKERREENAFIGAAGQPASPTIIYE